MLKDNRVFFFVFFLKSYLYLRLKTYKYWRSEKKIIYQRICMTKYILTIWSSFTPQCVPSYTGQAILVRKINIHAYSMYVQLADKVSCPMTQHFDSSDSVTMQNGWNNRISDGCVYAQIRRGLGMHLVTYSNHDTVLFLLIVPIKGQFV